MKRREFCMGGVAALSLVGASRSVAHAATMTSVHTLSDGSLRLPTDFLLPNGPPETLDGQLFEIGANDTIEVPCNVTLLKGADRIVLFDCGGGPNFLPSVGDLPNALSGAAIEPADVTDIVFTHAHPDHLWGVLDGFDDLLFSEARYHINRREWDFWRSETAMDAMPEERQSFVVGARNRFDAIEASTHLFEDGDEVVSGVEAVAAPGHTPGHSAFVIHSASPTMVVGDAIPNDSISFALPDYPWGADYDPDQGATTRARLLDRIAGDQMRLIGFHLPHGGIGRVDRADEGFRFVAEI